MNNTECPLCGGQENKKCFSERRHDFLSCSNCGLFFIDPYGADAHEKVPEYNYDDLQIIKPEKFHISSTNYYKRLLLSRIKEECANAKSILDVGCGTGALLALLKNERPDMRRVGVELNTERFEFAKKSAECEIYQIPLEKFSYDSKFDVITMINVLSHIPSFDSLFDSIHNLLSADGKFILKVGEMEADVEKNAIFDWGIPDHLHFLGIHTMDYICEKYGFKIIHHDRRPLSEDMFSFGRWYSPGRSSVRNLAKRIIALTPFALRGLRILYNMKHGEKIYSSFIVVSPTTK